MPVDSFVHIADLHFWEIVLNPLRLLNKRFLGNANLILRRSRHYFMDRAEAYADQVAKTGLGTVVLTGDFSTTSTDREFQLGVEFVRGLQRRGMDTFLLPGNHDVYTFESVKKRRFEAHFEGLLPEKGYPVVQNLPGGTPLVLAPTVRPNRLSSRGYVSDGTAQEVQSLLDTGQTPAVVAGHYPVIHNTYSYRTTPSRRLINANRLRESMGAVQRPLLYLYGHVHRFCYIRDDRHPNLSHLSTGAFFRNAPESKSFGEFTEVHVQETGFRVLRHRLGQEWVISEEIPR